MSLDDQCTNSRNEKKIRFRSGARVLFNTDGKIEDLLKSEKCDMPVDDGDSSRRG